MALSTCTALDPRGGESEPRGDKCSPLPPLKETLGMTEPTRLNYVPLRSAAVFEATVSTGSDEKRYLFIKS